MPNSQNILSYPMEMLDAIASAAEGDVVSYPCPSRDAAFTLRSRFYTLRSLLRKSDDPMYHEIRQQAELVTFVIIGDQLNIEPKSSYLRRQLPTPTRSKS